MFASFCQPIKIVSHQRQSVIGTSVGGPSCSEYNSTVTDNLWFVSNVTPTRLSQKPSAETTKVYEPGGKFGKANEPSPFVVTDATSTSPLNTFTVALAIGCLVPLLITLPKMPGVGLLTPLQPKSVTTQVKAASNTIQRITEHPPCERA
jgi:hypothetical protein